MFYERLGDIKRSENLFLEQSYYQTKQFLHFTFCFGMSECG
uniref:Uncharacterized protein n=1 Tax=Arundo donax TaxID=35708 RepID=A0A0A9AVT7_ARUDO